MSASGAPYSAYPPGQLAFQDWWAADDLLPADDTDDTDFTAADIAAAEAHARTSWLDSFLDSAVAADPAFAYANAVPYHMSPSRPQPGRLSNGYVDLTSPHVDLTEPDSPPRCRKRESPAPGPSAKRQKRDDGPAAPVAQIDLSQGDDILPVLQKQREEAVKAQARPVETVTTFNTFHCVICMDRPTDITATACGHLFCHTCLMEALIAGENRTGPGETKRSQCPVCRKNISRTKATDTIPLLLKTALATQPRRKPGPMPDAPKVQ